jgi:hypothetical protein
VSTQEPIRPEAKALILQVLNGHVDSAPDLTDLPEERYMGDAGWEQREVRRHSEEEVQTMVRAALEASRVKVTPSRLERYTKMINPLVAGVIMNEMETRWLELCWEASSGNADFLWKREQEASVPSED